MVAVNRNGEIYVLLRKWIGSFPGGIPQLLTTFFRLNAIPADTNQEPDSEGRAFSVGNPMQESNLASDVTKPQSFADIATALSVLVAIIVFIFSTLRSRIINRRQHTLTVLALINDDNPVSRAQLEMALWIREKREIKDDNVNPEEDKTIIAILDFYDFVCHTAEKKKLDIDTVVTVIGGRMRSTYNLLWQYIQARRDRLDRKNLYAPFERFVEKHVKNRDV